MEKVPKEMDSSQKKKRKCSEYGKMIIIRNMN